MPMSLSEEVLMGIAAVATALIGFSGVVTALGHGAKGAWSQHESIQLFALVVPSIVSLASAFAPVAIGLVTENSDLIWKGSNGVCFVGHLVGVTTFIRSGSAETILFSHKVGLTMTFLVMGGMLGSMLGLLAWPELTFLLGLLLGIGVSVHNFYLLLFPAAGSGED